MRFDRPPADGLRARRRPPPHYLGAAWQLRLLTMVGLLLLVLYMMKEARKPERWAWMWADAPHAAHEPGREGHRVLIRERAAPRDTPGPHQRVHRDAWSRITTALDPAQRTALDAVLLASRRRSALTAQQLNTWRAAFEHIAALWDEFLTVARSSLDDNMAPEQREAWTAVLAAAEAEWSDELLPALRAPLEARDWSERDRQALLGVQEVLDVLAFEAIRDDTVSRTEEQAAWFRLLEQLQQRDATQLRDASRGEVGYAALLRQPDAYRGELVTVRGTVRLAYQVAAPPNLLDIHHYYVLWLHPAAGPNLPLVVYALDLPPGFPPVAANEEGQGTELAEEVELTGFFFKRWAYAAQDDLRSVPLLLAASPRWHHSAAAEAEIAPPAPANLGGWILGAAATALALAYWAHRATRTPRRTRSGASLIQPPLPSTAPPEQDWPAP